MVGISVSLGDFQLACANCYSLENTKLVRNLFVGVKRNESATSALDTNWLVYFLGKLMCIHNTLIIMYEFLSTEFMAHTSTEYNKEMFHE